MTGSRHRQYPHRTAASGRGAGDVASPTEPPAFAPENRFAATSIASESKNGRLTGQSLLRAEQNSNECNWSTARKKIGPVNRPYDRPIGVISIASLMFLVTSRLADQRTKEKS